MKLFCIVFFSLQIITNNTFIEDITRIPALIQHFNQHQKKETPNISFFDFIVLHYSSDKNSTDISHHSLPLKHANDVGHVHTIQAFTVPDIHLSFTVIPSDIHHSTALSQFISHQCLESIFQPPKNC